MEISFTVKNRQETNEANNNTIVAKILTEANLVIFGICRLSKTFIKQCKKVRGKIATTILNKFNFVVEKSRVFNIKKRQEFCGVKL